MNKKLITLAVAAAMVAPLAAVADTTLYGRIHTSLEYEDGDAVNYFQNPATGAITTTDAEADGTWNVRNETTRIGVKGSEDLGNGLKAIFQAEWAFNSAEGGSTGTGLANRLAYAGLTGGWGTAAIGRQWTPYYGAVDKADIFNGGSFNNQYIGTFRTGNAVSYITPNFGGFVGKGALVIDAGDNEDNDIDGYNLSGEYNNGGLSLGIGYHHAEGGDSVAAVADSYYTSNLTDPDTGAFGPPGTCNEGDAIDTTTGACLTSGTAAYSPEDTGGWGIGGSYNFGMFKIIGQYEDWDVALPGTGVDFDMKEWTIAGEAYFGNHTIRGMFGNLDFDLDDENSWVLGYQYSLSKRTRVYTEYGETTGVQRDNLKLAHQIASLQDGKIWNFGLRHDF